MYGVNGMEENHGENGKGSNKRHHVASRRGSIGMASAMTGVLKRDISMTWRKKNISDMMANDVSYINVA